MIITIGNSILHKTAKPVTNFGSAELKELTTVMFQTMREKNGVGLAAPQIGVSLRLFVYGFEHSSRYTNVLPIANTIIINPEVQEMSPITEDFEEGCLSIPNKRCLVSRSTTVTFTSFDVDGNIYTKTVNDFEARIFQHELDHINGILISDHNPQMRDYTNS